jgi:hypothetical protein
MLPSAKEEHLFTILMTAIGIALNALVIRDIFHTLFAATGTGSLSMALSRVVWRGFKRISRDKRRRLALAGPTTMLLIIAMWTLGLVWGWACLMWPHLPGSFLLSTGMSPEQNDSLLDAIYLSLVTLGTLGYGEITPQSTWVRLIAPLEALIGFALFTASISWLMSIYPAMARRRHLARYVSLYDRAQVATGRRHDGFSCTIDGAEINQMKNQVISVRDDFVQFPITYLFHTPDARSSLAATLPTLLHFADKGSADPDPKVQLQAVMLRKALDDLATCLADPWLDCDADASTGDIFWAHAIDQGWVANEGSRAEGN